MFLHLHGGPPGNAPLPCPRARAPRPLYRARRPAMMSPLLIISNPRSAFCSYYCHQFTSVATCKATMIFISAAAAVFLVSKFKEIDWAFVVLPDEEHEHERYFLSEPQKKIVHAETSQGMVRSVCAFNFLLSRPA